MPSADILSLTSRGRPSSRHVPSSQAVSHGDGATIPLAAARAAAGQAGGHSDEDLSGAVITSDALHVHRDNIQQLTDRGGDYILTVKGNMPSLERDIAALFPAGPANGGAFPSPRHQWPQARPQRDPLDLDHPHLAGLDFPGINGGHRRRPPAPAMAVPAATGR